MFSTKVFIAVAVLASCAVLIQCNVIGGSINTDFTTDEGIRSFLSRSKLFSRLASRLEMMAPRTADNPFLRNKRAADCPVPSDLPQRVMDLNPYLNATQFVGLIKQDEGDYKPLPKDQPSKKDCPAATGSWWPRPEFNLRSTCPWVLEERDLGEEYFPRKIQEAVCMCQNCVNANAMNCEKLRHKVTLFKRGACNQGIAVMTKVEMFVTVGCYCASSVKGVSATPTTL